MSSDTENEFCLDYLSEHSSCSSDSDDSDDSDTIDRSRLSEFSLQYNDSESNDDDDIETDDNIWSTTDKTISLEPFEGNSGIKIMPKSQERVADIVNLFIGEDFFELMVKESNRYHDQVESKYKGSSKAKKWTEITVPEMKKFLGLILLMGQVRKEQLYDYWSTNPVIETPIFPKLMNRNRFMQIWQSWHFCNNDNITPNSNRLVKVQPVTDYLKNKFNDVYKPVQQLLLDEYIIPWHRKVSFKTYNPAKIIKYGILVSQICEATTGYVCNFEIYTGEKKELEETILNVIKPYTNRWYHIYQDNYYNSINLAQTLIKKKIRVCGTIWTNKGLPKSLQSIKLSKGQTTFRRNQDVLLQIWNDGKRNIDMISTIHSARLIDTVNSRTKQVIQKPESILDYNKYIKTVDRADRHLTYYNVFKRTKKWTKRVVLFFVNCALFNAFKMYTKLNGKKKSYEKFLYEVAREWVTDYGTIEQEDLPNSQSVSIEESDVPSTSNPTRRTPKVDNPGRLSNFKLHKLVRIVSDGKSKMPQRQCKVCASKKIRSRTCFVCKFCNVPLHKGDCTERYHTLVKY